MTGSSKPCRVLFSEEASPCVTLKVESVPPDKICDGVYETTTTSPDVFGLDEFPVKIWPTPVAGSVVPLTTNEP